MWCNKKMDYMYVQYIVRTCSYCWVPGKYLFVEVPVSSTFLERCTPNGTFWEFSHTSICFLFSNMAVKWKWEHHMLTNNCARVFMIRQELRLKPAGRINTCRTFLSRDTRYITYILLPRCVCVCTFCTSDFSMLGTGQMAKIYLISHFKISNFEFQFKPKFVLCSQSNQLWNNVLCLSAYAHFLNIFFHNVR